MNESPTKKGNQMTTEDPPEHEPSVFIDWLRDQRGGELLLELDEAITDVIQSVRQLGKKGSLTISVGVQQRGAMVEVMDDVTVKPARSPRTADIFFTDAEGIPHREDPAQLKADFSRPNFPELGELRVVNTNTGEITNKTATGETSE